MQSTFPRLDIGPLSEYRDDDIMVGRFSEYLQEHQNLVFPHRHSFYHLVLFTDGGGKHTIDFHHFEVVSYQIYFMLPGQVHSWNFEGEMEGYVVNFSESFFRSFLLKPDYLDFFSFLNGDSRQNVVELAVDIRPKIAEQFEELLRQYSQSPALREDMIRVLLLQLFLTIEQSISTQQRQKGVFHKNAVIGNFQKLIERNYTKHRLPGEYAEMLNVTPNHLNALCKEHIGMQAGELIRNRITLEAKRLLVNLDLTVSEIAYQLNFSDNSYFTKFFKKEAGMTPEEFRKKSADE
ncbi:helix-turn-helix domain-containing protein [Dyadobacter pollutisoli]|uniref:Helix-turn-helix transcriptional regulator n=1 Tax=Dyadobacter pollutisoli TaxID=2910158 RepID=A0A9E8SMU8_9BACT|nr:helix-turn-helix transcriptional regulator [Dyadobacter pollutisoli]WAC14538.1 helix-turn-helix transcriptional regulator [Dyadobacter pollutisoli]